MSVEDIRYLKNNSIRQSFIALIDSSRRDLMAYPEPNSYTIELDIPIKNVVGIEIIESSVPRTMYSVDKYNNTFYYYIHSNFNTDECNNVINIMENSNILNYEKDPTYNGIFKKLEMKNGDYNINTFCEYFNNAIKINIQNNYNNNYWQERNENNTQEFRVNAYDSENPEITNTLRFDSDYPFILNMRDSTIAETIGFFLLINSSLNNINYTYLDKYANNINFLKLYHSFYDPSNRSYTVVGPGLVCFTGEKYIVMHAREIEDHSLGSLSYIKNTIGIAKFRTNSLGFNDEIAILTKIPIREFHPIGKLTKLTFQFLTAAGKLYDFKGVNHNFTLAIYYFEPKLLTNEVFNSILNPNYKMNFNDYKYTNEEQEILNDDEDEDDEDDDDDNTFSRDNLNLYKINEQKYNY
jgi:hypothetical protein